MPAISLLQSVECVLTQSKMPVSCLLGAVTWVEVLVVS
jgi:hypothetical protein